MLWKLNRIQYPVYNLGRGKRIALWVQGCSLACEACISETLQTKNGGKEIEIVRLSDELLKISSDFDGITVTGGEPFQQYAQLIVFCAYIKKMSNLEISVFSGYTLNELNNLFPDRLFMKYIDYLTDGRYVKDHHDNKYLRGSANQKLYKFENDTATLQEPCLRSKRISIKVDPDKQVYLTGIPKKDELEQLSKQMKQSGIELFFK